MSASPPQKIELSGKLIREELAQFDAVWLQLQPPLLHKRSHVLLDLAQVTHIDSAGVALLLGLARLLKQNGQAVQLSSVPQHIQSTLAIFPYPTDEPSKAKPGYYIHSNVLLAVGEASYQAWLWCRQYAYLWIETIWLGSHNVSLKLWRLPAIMAEMYQTGPAALLVVGLIAILMGATIALQSAAQLRLMGANLMLVDLIGVSISRELGPLMTAVVVAGRTGSAIAAEIATMVITEELDALKSLGLQPIRFVVLPKMIALMLMQPLLTIYSNVVGIFGGMLVGVFFLNISMSTFLSRLPEVVSLKDVSLGLYKSFVFALLTASIGAFYGLRTHGGADAVGISTTRSVVATILAIVAADALCSFGFSLRG